jgi:hypothetical protein
LLGQPRVLKLELPQFGDWVALGGIERLNPGINKNARADGQDKEDGGGFRHKGNRNQS